MKAFDGVSGKRPKLGRGLSALLRDDRVASYELTKGLHLQLIPISEISPGFSQPRQIFNDEDLNVLAKSMREKGVLQPILLRPSEKGGYEIIAGERRWRAAQLAQMHEIPAQVRDFTDIEALEVALIENIQRSDLKPLEEAQGYKRLIDEYGHTHEKIGATIGKSRSHVANTLRLLGLPERTKAYLNSGHLSAGHARALLGSVDPDGLAETVVARDLSVRATEKLVKSLEKSLPETSGHSADPSNSIDPHIIELETRLSNQLGLKIKVQTTDRHQGKVSIYYKSLDQLDDIILRLQKQKIGF